MNKNAALTFFISLISAFSAYSITIDKTTESSWVDSVYSSMTYEERIGQLIISKKSEDYIINSIIDGGLPVGGIYLPSSNVYPTNVQKGILAMSKNQTFWVFLPGQENREWSDFDFPGEVSKAAVPSIETVHKLETAEAVYNKQKGGNIIFENNAYLENINGEFIFHDRQGRLSHDKQVELSGIKHDVYNEHGFISAINLSFTFDNYDFVKYIPGDLYKNENWGKIKEDFPMMLINDLNFKGGWQPDKFKKEIVKGLLRKKFEYEGVLGMDVQEFYGQFIQVINRDLVEIALIRSGVDIIITDDPQKAFKNLYANWKKHELRNSEIEEKVKNILRQKYKQANSSVTTPLANPSMFKEEVENLLYEAYASSVTLIENEGDIIPIKNLETSHFASLSIGADRLTRFQESLDQYTGFTHFVLPANQINTEAFHSLIRKLGAFDQVVVGIHAPFTKDMLSLLSALEFKTNVIAAIFDDEVPDNLLSVTNSLFVTYENNDYLQEIVPQLIFGARPCQGQFPLDSDGGMIAGIKTEGLHRLSIALPYNVGMDGKSLLKIDSLALIAISEGATPGCQVLVAKDGKVIYEKAFGNYTYEQNYPVTPRTMYDLASVTKVAATTQAIMFLVDQGMLDLNRNLSYYLPELAKTNKGDLIIRDILTHQSGLKAFLPFWYQTIDFENLQLPFYSNEPDEEYQLEVGYGMYGSLRLQDSLYAWTVKSGLRTKPRRKKFEPYDYKYSDLGFYLMYALAERLLNQPMDEFLAQNIYEPLGMSSTTFNPLCKFPASSMAPTEDDKTFRHSLVWGTVHDQVAAMNGGVSGHAGLFGNAIDLAKICQMQLQGGYYGGQSYFTPGVINEFTSVQNRENRRGLGWDKPYTKDVVNNPTSAYSSPSTYGHRGFTGTVVWVDPDQDLIYVFLSNRIYPDMGNGKLNNMDIRKKIHDVVYESIINFGSDLN